MEDTAIIDLYWQRSETAITASEDKYGSYCHTIAYNILSNFPDAEECVNDTWLHAWNAMPPQKPRLLSAFFGKITRNLSLDRYRRSTAAKRGGCTMELALEELSECVPAPRTTEDAVDERLLTACLEGFVRSLPAQKQRIFLRRYWYLSSIDDIAADYGMSRSKVTSLLYRTRQGLKHYLEREGIVL